MLRIIIALLVGVAGFTLVEFNEAGSTGEDYSTTPLYQLSQEQLDQHLQFLATAESNPITRLQRLIEQSIGQPYQEGVLGEGTYDSHDSRPLYALDRSDSRSFVEQALAMSVASDFESFFLLLQRLRYKEGRVATADRNHNLLADWIPNNEWLLEDVTESLADGMAWVPVHQVVQRSNFLQEQFGITSDTPDEKFIGSCIPRVYLHKVLPELQAGDVIMLITGKDWCQFANEMGLIDIAASVDSHQFIQSHEPVVEQIRFGKAIWTRKDILGIKVLRLRADALSAAMTEVERMRGMIAVP